MKMKNPRVVRPGVLLGLEIQCECGFECDYIRILLAKARSTPLAYYARNTHKKEILPCSAARPTARLSKKNSVSVGAVVRGKVRTRVIDQLLIPIIKPLTQPKQSLRSFIFNGMEAGRTHSCEVFIGLSQVLVIVIATFHGNTQPIELWAGIF